MTKNDKKYVFCNIFVFFKKKIWDFGHFWPIFFIRGTGLRRDFWC